MKQFFLNFRDWLLGFGAFGLFGIALLDAALIPIPGGPDVVLMTLAHLNHALMPLYVLAAALGSTLGCLVPYWIGRASGEAALRKFSPEKRERASRLIRRYDLWSMMVGAILPPPFPFKVFLISAGVFRMSVWRFLIALSLGRIVRFTLEGVAAVRYGNQAVEFFTQPRPKVVIGVVAMIILIFIISALLRRRHKDDEMSDGDLRTAE